MSVAGLALDSTKIKSEYLYATPFLAGLEVSVVNYES